MKKGVTPEEPRTEIDAVLWLVIAVRTTAPGGVLDVDRCRQIESR
jgi:hypothetical protein